MAEKTRLRVFEEANGHRYVKQFTESECQAYLSANPTLKLIR